MKKVLICDDDIGITEMMKIMLEEMDCKVAILTNGRAVVKKVKEYLPDLILLDIWMPGMDGKEISKLLKRDVETKHVPIVIVSALHQNEVRKLASDLSVEGFLLKPFTMAELQKIVFRYTK